jgi:hypothetical protein
MNYIDVFNGDADGICALIQLRLSEPRNSMLITGVKRDINLLKQVDNTDEPVHITVLDISMEKNSSDLLRLLNAGAEVDYIDHHKTGDIPSYPKLTTLIDLKSDVCTSLLVNKRLQGKYKEWALTAAFGDNLSATATKLGLEYGFTQSQLDVLAELGILLNYNGYGATTDDLLFHPAELYKKLHLYKTPFEFIEQESETFKILKQGYETDMDNAHHADIIHQSNIGKIIELPNDAWARRISGVYGNQLANESPNLAHAVIQKRADNESYLISIRAPLSNKEGADELASQFPTGGGRKAAAGVNALPEEMLPQFIEAFETIFAS